MTKALAKYDIEVLALPADVTLLEDNSTFTNRFDFHSASGKEYRIAQSKKGRWWSCGCPSYKFGKRGSKTCKHLRDFGLRGDFVPEEVGQLSVGGAVAGSIGAAPMPNAKRAEVTQGNKAKLRALQGGASSLTITAKRRYDVQDDIKKLGGKWNADAKGWDMPSQEAFDAVQALLEAPKAVPEAPKALPAAPKALPACKPEGVEMKDGKIVVTFDASQSAAVFALLAQLS